MSIKTITPNRIFSWVVAVLVTLFLHASAQAELENYKIDSVHSSVIFRVKHMDVSYSYGRFNEPQGMLTLDTDDPSRSSFKIQVKSANIDTGNKKRDTHLKSPDFFNVRQFPMITFESKSVKKLDGDQFEIKGPLTLHGVTKEITLKLKQTGAKTIRNKQVRGFETMFKINRTDYGMKNMLEGVSDEILLVVSLEVIQQPGKVSRSNVTPSQGTTLRALISQFKPRQAGTDFRRLAVVLKFKKLLASVIAHYSLSSPE
ncbi:MAG: YceI family protein [Planctomycetes bacterium]|nr:YceI family protein [Planctomycetota bacterium]